MRITSVTNFKINTFKSSPVKHEKEPNTIGRALSELEKVTFEKNDILYVESIGAKLPFRSGREAVDYIKNSDIKIIYSNFDMKDIHARWQFEDNTIHINNNYKNNDSFADILGISEAIFHEAGHAKDKDNDNSIQEELNCLSLNVLAHRYYKSVYKDIFSGQNSFLFSEGVSLYEKLFSEFDPKKTKLKERIQAKYGFLEASSKMHPASKFAIEIKNYKKPNI